LPGTISGVQSRAGIAGEDGLQVDVRSSKQLRIIQWFSAIRKISWNGPAETKVRVVDRLKVGTRLETRDSRDLPAFQCPTSMPRRRA
jgi:hypothetical protein